MKRCAACFRKLSRKKILLFITLLLFLIGLTVTAVYLESVADYQNTVKETIVRGIDISEIPDGIYVGEYDVDFIYAKVEVTVRNGSITDIAILEHKNGRGKSAEIITDRIMEEQRTDVDAVSGATNSSVVIKKAVENALDGNRKSEKEKDENFSRFRPFRNPQKDIG